MARGESTQHKVHYKGPNTDEDFLVFVDDPDQYKQWLHDSSIPLAQFVSTFQIFVTHRQGVQGMYGAASGASLHSEFDTEDVDEVIKKILQSGSVQTMEMPGRQGVTNDSMSYMRAK